MTRIQEQAKTRTTTKYRGLPRSTTPRVRMTTLEMSGKTEGEGEGCDEGAGVGEEIAVAGVEGEVVLVAEVDADAGSLVARGGGGDSAVGIDGGGDSGVGGAKDPAVIFDGAHANHVEVLPGGAGVAVPAVVGDVDQDIGAFLANWRISSPKMDS